MSSAPLILDHAPDAVTDDAARYLLGEADAGTVQRLAAALQSDPGQRARFAALARLHGHLSEIGRRAAGGDVDSARLLAAGPPTTADRPATTRRPLRRWLGLTAAAAALLALGLAVLSLAVIGLRTRSLIPTITACHGAVQVLRDGTVLAAGDGLRLRSGDRLAISDGAVVEITLAGGRCTQDGAATAGGTSAVIASADELHRKVVLDRGQMDADIGTGSPVAIRTPAALISVSDAAARIEVGPLLTGVAVRRGRVAITTPDGASRDLPAGQRWDGAAPAAPGGGPLAHKE
jgi:hypothetical protein